MQEKNACVRKFSQFSTRTFAHVRHAPHLLCSLRIAGSLRRRVLDSPLFLSFPFSSISEERPNEAARP